MKSLSKWIRRFHKAIRYPNQIVPILKLRTNSLAYHWNDGSWAPPPREIKLFVNNSCNAHCIMCDIGQRNRETQFYRQLIQTGTANLSLDSLQRILDTVAKFRPKINICGTEPLLHPQLMAVLSLAKQAHLYTHLTTNGILLARFAQELIDSGIDSITVSIDGPEPIHDQIRGAGTFQKAIEGLRMLLEKRAAAKSKLMVTTNYCISHLNYDQIVTHTHQMLCIENVDQIKIIHPFFVTPEASALQNQLYPKFGVATAANISGLTFDNIDPQVVWEQINEIKQHFHSLRVFENIELPTSNHVSRYYHQPGEPIGNKHCLLPWREMTITSGGDVLINNRCFAPKVGNIHENSLMDIWNGEPSRTFRRELKKNGLFPVCSRCCGITS